ncbi:FHA domain-containing protein [Vibrio vulnificus]|jgi:type VI secretion system protein ImpI|uniref:type VI secretion system-associated FHA domain protein n=1 Tax=Vibrio vulnificus TaxID=672 RepID=UPI000A3B9DCF|nr:FHA domain-containing protein [Vibrio vulnificus]EGQ7695243.1 FHA domain-containing protein [Vibrio vulnificus]EGQ8025381.1 FHA domain-containing protein [Vibrio vulnificus]EGQ8077988.1 FHA domain-containing protein [Vibrio vulnificus]EGR0070759.1 FHA domain-containing protein [Vibrio vulnificus]EHD2251926.1 FHA domain-containing protein [Vibrio vulnificus]
MPLSIRIISSPDGESISEWHRSFPEEGGEIGRAYGSTLQLSDSSRAVSGTHAIIRKSSRGYQILDNSTNGLFINGATAPLGKGNQSTLNDGDVLDIGRYRLLVSCFIPAQASATVFEPAHSTIDALFGDDPFSLDREDESSAEPPWPEGEKSAQPEAQFSSYEPQQVLQDDPFLSQAAPARQERKAFNPSFSAIDDDPFQEPSFSVALSSSSTRTPSHSSSEPAYALTEFKNSEERQLQQMEKAMEMALARLLSELSPDTLENMFNDLSAPSFFARKPKYWDMYKRYFNRQLQNRDWQIKFHAYFQDSLRIQRNLAGEE